MKSIKSTGINAFVVEAKRTAIGRSHAEKGCFRNVRADVLLAELIGHFATTYFAATYPAATHPAATHPAATNSAAMPLTAIDDVYIGCVGQHLEQGKNIARLAAMLAGLPEQVPGVTINRLCASSLQAFHFAAQALHSGQADVLLAGGIEHMHHVPMGAALDYSKELLARYEFPFTQMGLTAEKVADQYKISRQEQDEFSLHSHQKAVLAQKAGYFEREIHAVPTPSGLVDRDQGPRPDTTLETLAGLKGVFRENGSVTSGNSSPLSDGASLTLLASEKGCQTYGLKKRAQVIEMAVVGVDPCMMGMGPVPAIEKLLKKAGMNISDIDLFEINEAFASQAIASIRALKLSHEKVNPSGGAIALGHPLGCTGTRLITTLLHGLERLDAQWGVAALCIGHGQGMATLVRRTN